MTEELTKFKEERVRNNILAILKEYPHLAFVGSGKLENRNLKLDTFSGVCISVNRLASTDRPHLPTNVITPFEHPGIIGFGENDLYFWDTRESQPDDRFEKENPFSDLLYFATKLKNRTIVL